MKKVRVPFLEARVFLSAEDNRARLPEQVLAAVQTRDLDDPEQRNTGRGIFDALTRWSNDNPPRFRIDRPIANALTRAMEEAGIRPSQRARKVGDYRLDSVDDFLDELEKFEDEITTPEPRECLVSDLTLAKQDDVLSDGLVVAIKKLEDMPDELELREQELPSQEDWEEAINRAGIIFGITVSSPRNASNVSDLATKLKEAAGKAVEECQIVTDDLDGKCGEWRIDSASSARFQLPEEDRPAVTLGDEVVDLIRNHPAVEVKGATYTELSVTRDENGTWTAGCVVDV